jgi:hypothetical protein
MTGSFLRAAVLPTTVHPRVRLHCRQVAPTSRATVLAAFLQLVARLNRWSKRHLCRLVFGDADDYHLFNKFSDPGIRPDGFRPPMRLIDDRLSRIRFRGPKTFHLANERTFAPGSILANYSIAALFRVPIGTKNLLFVSGLH